MIKRRRRGVRNDPTRWPSHALIPLAVETLAAAVIMHWRHIPRKIRLDRQRLDAPAVPSSFRHGRKNTPTQSLILDSSSRPRGQLLAATSVAVATLFTVGVPSCLASAPDHGLKITSAAVTRQAAKRNTGLGTLSIAARRALRHGYLVPHAARYRQQKERLTRQAEARQALAAPSTGSLAPSIISGKSWRGINDTQAAPPDETSAVGTSRYVELVNSKFAIYGKAGNTPIGTGSLGALSGLPGSHFDVQVIWDPTTSRFYYAMDDILGRKDNRVAFGFSKGASPSSAADWCKYSVGFGRRFPDFPKLGDSRNFEIIGSNLFKGRTGYRGPDLLAISKPREGARCPAGKSFKRDSKVLAKSTFTPVPANEIDTNATGWAVAIAGKLPSDKLRLLKVTRSPTGSPIIKGTGTAVHVPEYRMPPSAPEKGSANKLDTSDARNTQAVAAVDPRAGKLAIWTQHAVRGGAGAEERWYEIDPVARSVLQRGTVASSSLFVFNGAISPNRGVDGATRTGGGAMIMNFNTSSRSTFPSIKMVSKVGGGAQSGPVNVRTGTKPLGGFDCNSRHFCRWGDYAAATPDPSANRIWQVSQYAVGPVRSFKATSRTQNFVAVP